MHWADGGTTRLDNFALLCKRDHIAVHNGHLTIQIVNGHPHATRPTWANPNPPPPRRQPPQSPPPPPEHPPPQPWAAHPPDAATRCAGTPRRALGTSATRSMPPRPSTIAPPGTAPPRALHWALHHGLGTRWCGQFASRGDKRRL
ncbi:hypothetical protein OG555_03365 [Kribbella sp. NBC_01484]